MSPLFNAFLNRTLLYVYYTTSTTNTKSQTYINFKKEGNVKIHNDNSEHRGICDAKSATR